MGVNINQIILSALDGVGIPAEPHHYDGSSSSYIRFFEYDQGAGLEGDDDEQVTVYYIQLDIFTPRRGGISLRTMTADVKDRMKDAGFKKQAENSFYEEETGNLHKMLRFYLLKRRND